MIFATSLPIFIPIIALISLAAFAIFCVVNNKFRQPKIFRRIAMVALLVIAIMRPAIGTTEIERELTNINVYFVVDNTGSMATRDMNAGSTFRFQKVAEDMKKIVQLFPGSKYSIIALDFNIYQAMPLISSADTVLPYINSLSPKNSTVSSDTNLSKLLSYAKERIKKYSSRFPDRSNVMFFLSDGGDKSAVTVDEELKDLLSGGAIIGYGGTTSSPVYEIDYNNEVTDKILINPTTKMQVNSSLNEASMQDIASSLGLPYYRRSTSNDIFDKTESFINAETRHQKSDSSTKVDNELYWIPALLLVAILIYDLLKIADKLLLERKAVK
ncbi:MAG: VWA domain-containing protein [Candidatus Saccharibacteria bacterium]|nr:VWA domain-containing protein [Candidatus Saccharibacteria bacterium]